MPGYKDHQIVSVAASVITAGGVFVGYQLVYRGLEYFRAIPPGSVDKYLTNTLSVMALVAAGVYFGGTLNSPDLDIPSTPYNHWGGFRFLWLPYQIMVRHRSPFSHWPVLGTVFKMVYMLLTLNILTDAVILMINLWFAAVGQATRIPLTIGDVFIFFIQPLRYPMVWVFIIGDIIGETSHIVTDWLDGRRRARYWDETVPALSDNEPDAPHDSGRHRYG